jgi:hypothetical protein
METKEKGMRPRKVYVLDEETAERIVRMTNQLAEALDVVIFNRERIISETDEFERRLCGQLQRDIQWATLNEIF